MRRQTCLFVLIAVAITLLTGCGLPSLPRMPVGGGTASGNPPWPDVPQLPGSKQVSVELPLPIKLLTKGFVSAAQSSGDNKSPAAKDYDFKVYQASGSGTDVSGFYTQTLMSATGWSQKESACGSSSPVATVAGATLCLYIKPAADGFTDNLAILLMPGQGEGGSDQLAYVRFSNKG